MWEEYELTFNNAKALRNEEYDNLTEMKKSITQIKEDIRNSGMSMSMPLRNIKRYPSVTDF